MITNLLLLAFLLWTTTGSWCLTDKEIFSLYPSESGKKSVTIEEWFSDDWDAMNYAIDYDFSNNFFTVGLIISSSSFPITPLSPA